jgi:hypothetical protein
MGETCTVTGVLSEGRTVILDEAVPLSSGPVRVTVETLPVGQYGREFISRLTAIREALYASGYRPRSRKEVDAQLETERTSWETC